MDSEEIKKLVSKYSIPTTIIASHGVEGISAADVIKSLQDLSEKYNVPLDKIDTDYCCEFGGIKAVFIRDKTQDELVKDIEYSKNKEKYKKFVDHNKFVEETKRRYCDKHKHNKENEQQK